MTGGRKRFSSQKNKKKKIKKKELKKSLPSSASLPKAFQGYR
jgi:hypothetical protein